MEETVVIGFPKLGITDIEIDPVALRLGSIEIRWYGILILLGVLVATFFGMRKKKNFNHTTDDMLDILLVTLPCAIIGCRLYFCAFKWDYYKNNPLEIITGITEGGLAFYGGLIGAVVSGLIVMKVKKLNIPAILDLYITQFPIAQAIGRWGNFMNGEAYGGLTDLPWGMTVNGYGPVHPTFLYESLWNVGVFIILYLHLDHRRFNGQNALMYLLLYGLGRAWIEGLRADSLYIGDTGIRVSQLLSVVVVLISAALLIMIPIIKKKRDLAAAVAGADYVPIVSDESASVEPLEDKEEMGAAKETSAPDLSENIGHSEKETDK